MKIGYIGLGLMGEPIAQNLLKKSKCEMWVYDLDPNAANELKAKGANVARSIMEVVSNTDLIFTMVPRDSHVIEVFNEVLELPITGKIFVEMSTISPAVSVEIAHKVKELGASLLDCPVVKSRPAAISGTLGIYVGGDEDSYQIVKQYLEMIGENNIYLGENGSGLIMKLCHNTLVAEIQNGVNEMITLACDGAGVSIDTFATAMSYGGAQNFYLDSKKNSLSNADYTTMFSVENMEKDVQLTKKYADDLQLNFQGLNNVVDIYEKALSKGLSKEDFCATIKLFKESNE